MKTKLPRFILTICSVVIGAHVYGQISTQRLVKDICTVENSLSNDFRQITSDGKGIFFVAEHDTFGVELWYSDGTPDGTKVLKDISPGSATSNPNILEYSNNLLYFYTIDSTQGLLMWQSDGSASGTLPLTDQSGNQLILPLESTEIHRFDNAVFYRLRETPWITSPIQRRDIKTSKTNTVTVGDSVSTTQLTIKTKSGLVVSVSHNESHLFRFIHKDSSRATLLPVNDSVKIEKVYSSVVKDNQIYFVASDSLTFNRSLYRYDLSNQTCLRFASLSSDKDYLRPTLRYIETQNGILFIADQNSMEEIWMAKHHSDSLQRIGDISIPRLTGIENLLYHDNQVFFTTRNEYPLNQHLIWRVNLNDLTIDTFNIAIGKVSFHSSRPFYTEGSKIIFSGHSFDVGAELFQYDMINLQTTLVTDIATGPRHSYLYQIHRVDENIFTNSYDGILGNELGVININNPDSFTWLTRTSQIPGSSFPANMAVSRDKLHFIATDIVNGYQLVEIDIKTEKPNFIAAPPSPGYGYFPKNVTSVNGIVYFTNVNSVGKEELCRVDSRGNLERIKIPVNFAQVRNVRTLQDVFFVEVYSAESRLEHLLYITNRTNELTFISSSAYQFHLHEAATLGSKMYYSLRNVLYEFDVTTLQNERSSIVSLNTEVYTPIRTDGHNLYFTAYDKTKLFGIELWQSDGTRENTKMIVDHTPGPASTLLTDLTIFNRNVAFSTLSLDGITEVWAYIHNIKTIVLIKTHGPFTPIKIHSPSTESDCLFLTLTNIFGGQNLWCYNAKTSKLELFHSTTKQKDVVGLYPYYLDGWCYYLNTTSDDASTLYKTDGTIQGTSIVKRWEPSDNINMPTNLMLADRKLFYSAYSTEYGRELFVMDLPNHQVTAKYPIKLLPNPVTDYAKLLVHGRTANEAADVRVFNVSGQLVQQITANTNPIELNFEYLTPGVYIIRLANGMSTKFIKL